MMSIKQRKVLIKGYNLYVEGSCIVLNLHSTHTNTNKDEIKPKVSST